jgi:transcriptional regulator GlxA family with amidase domain
MADGKKTGICRQTFTQFKKAIADIVIESGFTNVTHFDRIFKKHFGETPLQHRKKLSDPIVYA